MKNVIEFEKLVASIVDEQVTFFVLENQNAKKWYEKQYVRTDTLEPSTKYGVQIDGMIDFDFTTTKDEDGFLKSFISQYTSKRKMVGYVNGQVTTLNKSQLMDRIVTKNRDRVHFGLFYTTLYGIGLYDFFNGPKSHDALVGSLSTFLKNKSVKFENEYSDAMWVFRFRFPMHIDQTNQLLNEFKQINN